MQRTYRCPCSARALEAFVRDFAGLEVGQRSSSARIRHLSTRPALAIRSSASQSHVAQSHGPARTLDDTFVPFDFNPEKSTIGRVQDLSTQRSALPFSSHVAAAPPPSGLGRFEEVRDSDVFEPELVIHQDGDSAAETPRTLNTAPAIRSVDAVVLPDMRARQWSREELLGDQILDVLVPTKSRAERRIERKTRREQDAERAKAKEEAERAAAKRQARRERKVAKAQGLAEATAHEQAELAIDRGIDRRFRRREARYEERQKELRRAARTAAKARRKAREQAAKTATTAPPPAAKAASEPTSKKADSGPKTKRPASESKPKKAASKPTSKKAARESEPSSKKPASGSKPKKAAAEPKTQKPASESTTKKPTKTSSPPPNGPAAAAAVAAAAATPSSPSPPDEAATPAKPPRREKEGWQVQKAALEAKFGAQAWNPRKRISPDALAGIRALHAKSPGTFGTPVLAEHFKVAPEAIRRILKSKWQPSEGEVETRRRRWERRGQRKWEEMAEEGVRPPKRWRDMGVGRAAGGGKPAWKRAGVKGERWVQESGAGNFVIAGDVAGDEDGHVGLGDGIVDRIL